MACVRASAAVVQVVNGEGGVLLLPLCTLLVRSRRGRVAGVRSGRLGGRPPASRPSRRLAAPLSMSLSRRRCASSTSISTPDALTLGAPPSASSITPTVALRSSPRSRSSCRRRLRRSRSSVRASFSPSPGRTQRHWASTGRRPNRQSRRHTLPPHCPISVGPGNGEDAKVRSAQMVRAWVDARTSARLGRGLGRKA